jgi:carbonic anhydrase
VRWLVMKAPVTVSREQVEAFAKLIHHPNNRPVQALNGRIIVE